MRDGSRVWAGDSPVVRRRRWALPAAASWGWRGRKLHAWRWSLQNGRRRGRRRTCGDLENVGPELVFPAQDTHSAILCVKALSKTRHVLIVPGVILGLTAKQKACGGLHDTAARGGKPRRPLVLRAQRDSHLAAGYHVRRNRDNVLAADVSLVDNVHGEVVVLRPLAHKKPRPRIVAANIGDSLWGRGISMR